MMQVVGCTVWLTALAITIGCLGGCTREARSAGLSDKLRAYLNERATEFNQVAEDRKQLLDRAARYVRQQRDAEAAVHLVFVCTHNSRRSQMAHVWAQAAASYHGISDVRVYSGGTEATAFNPRAVEALRRAGAELAVVTQGANPQYQVRLGNGIAPLECFSKHYRHPSNPRDNFCAVMTCEEADEACPTVDGAALRIVLAYVDPKRFDATPEEAERYDQTCRQICREMLYLFAQVAAGSSDQQR